MNNHAGSTLTRPYKCSIKLRQGEGCLGNLRSYKKGFRPTVIGQSLGVLFSRVPLARNSETAVHCCDPPLSVLVMLVSRNVFHVVSALQSIVSDRIAERQRGT